jgi:hypothetical protein
MVSEWRDEAEGCRAGFVDFANILAQLSFGQLRERDLAEPNDHGAMILGCAPTRAQTAAFRPSVCLACRA